jgi:hypothetical protein
MRSLQISRGGCGTLFARDASKECRQNRNYSWHNVLADFFRLIKVLDNKYVAVIMRRCAKNPTLPTGIFLTFISYIQISTFRVDARLLSVLFVGE